MSTTTARILRGVFGALFALSFLLFAVLMTVRYTVLDAAWYRDVLDENRTYARIYDEVLVDPEVKSVTDDLMAGLPVDRSLIDANLRLVIPPDTLRDTINRTIITLEDYLQKDRDDIDAEFALGAIERNLERLNRAFISDIVTRLRPTAVFGLQDFAQRLLQVTDDVEAGRTPTALPAFPPVEGIEGPLTDLLVATVDDPPPDLRPQVHAAVVARDANAAFALILPLIRADEAAKSADQLREQAGGNEYDYGTEIVIDDDSPEMRTIQTVRDIIGDVLPLVTIFSAVVMVLTLFGIGYVARASGGNVVRTLAVTILVGGAFVNMVWLIVRLIIGDPLSGITSADSGLPSALRELIGDLGDSAFASFDGGILGPGQIAIIVGALALLVMWLAPKVVALVRRQGQQRLVRIGIVGAAVIAVVVAFLALRPEPVEAGDLRCNGHAELCDRRVDEVVFPMAHNAMSSSERAWIGANHDLAFPHQLDNGIRGLMFDWWTWETPDRLSEFADLADLPPEYVNLIRSLINTADPRRAGTYLCHGVCRLGYERLERGLREVKRWLHDNPNEVIVLIAEDHIPAFRGQGAMRASGLDEYVYTPPKDGDAPWPTLRELIESGERLIFFTEKRDGDAPWYQAAYKRHLMETPYTFDTPEKMSCEPNRGGTGKPLFLMNHWIQKAAPSRADAGVVNDPDFIVRRARRCEKERGQLPNFIAVDFASIGDVVAATNRLNGV